MSYEMLFGAEVTDDAIYTQYRAGSTPILAGYGGGFRHDFRVAEVLRPEADSHLNRIFTIYFTDQSAMEAFFADERYIEVKERYFDASVADIKVLAGYEQ